MAAPVPVRASLALVLVALALAPPAAAQALDPAVSVTLERTTLDLGAANATLVNATVTNGNAQVDGTVALSVSAPAGWTVTVDPSSSFQLAAGASQTVTIEIVAPAAGAGDATGDVTLSATITESAATARTDTASATLAVTRVDPVIPPPPPPAWYETPGGVAALVLVPLAIAGGVATVVVRKRRAERAAAEAARRAAEEAAARAAWLARETGVSLALFDGPRHFGAKRELTYRLHVQNVSDRPRVAVLHVAECPAGWTAAVSIPRMPLSPGERVLVTLYVNPDDAVAPGSPARFVLAARPEEAQERDERVVIECEAPAVRAPLDGASPTKAPRTNANQRLTR